MMKSVLLLLLTGFILGGCGTVLKVETNPEGADLYLREPDSDKKVFIGKTPIKFNVDDYKDKINSIPSSRKYVRLLAEAKNYSSKELLVPVATLGNSETIIRLKLDPYVSESVRIRQVIQYLMNTQEFINNGELKRAEHEVNRALSVEEENPWAYIMRAYIHLLKKDYKDSLADYERSLELDPSNEEIIKRVTDIRKILKEKVRQ